VEERGGEPAVNPVMRVLLEALAGDGAAVSVRVPEREVFDPLDEPPADLVLLKSDTDLALSRAVAAEMGGARFLNGARATLRAHDKAATVARLAAADLPIPKTFLFLPGVETARPSIEGRWIVKPVRGVHGRGVSFHEGVVPALGVPAETDGSFVADDGTRLLQSRVGGDEADVKVYVADGRCFAGRKRFSASSYETDEIEPIALDPETERIVLAAGATLDLNCFGVDLRFDGKRPVIIDTNPFPGYRGFPEAVEALRAEVERALEAACR
jgi:ribosomal protein S6--L-glutamate ligase